MGKETSLKIVLSALALMLVTSCSDGSDGLKGVTPDAYLDFASCWADADDRFVAFLVVEQNRDGFRPHFVSSRCYVAEFGGDTTMGYLNDLMIVGDESALKTLAGLTGDFLSNAVTDVGPPSDRSRVYLFRGDLVGQTVEEYPDARLYDIAKVDTLIDTQMLFSQFRKLTSDERSALFQSLSRRR
ncbi:MAG: hypothetical protein Q7T60_14600 [Sphingopyxis sp.]|nr:hypothetical protein [Sphingopyxis sp.]